MKENKAPTTSKTIMNLLSVSETAVDYRVQALGQCMTMAEKLLGSNKEVPPKTLEKLDSCIASWEAGKYETEKIVEVHNTLSKLLAPATPYSIFFLYKERKQHVLARFFGPAPIIRRMALLSVISLIVFVSISASNLISPEQLESNFMLRNNMAQLTTASFFIAAAAMGACFANLFRAYRYVSAGTYDPNLDGSYWVRIILGIIAGYILAELISLNFQSGFDKPLLALLGGFSGSAVFRILERFVRALEMVVQGDVNARIRASEVDAEARLRTQEMEHRQEYSIQLITLRDKLSQLNADDSVKNELDELIRSTFVEHK